MLLRGTLRSWWYSNTTLQDLDTEQLQSKQFTENFDLDDLK